MTNINEKRNTNFELAAQMDQNLETIAHSSDPEVIVRLQKKNQACNLRYFKRTGKWYLGSQSFERV